VAQIYLFSGDNAFALAAERRRWSKEFAQKHGLDNLCHVDGEKITLRALLDDIAAMPFLASKRLVIVEPIPDFSSEEWETVKNSIHPGVLLLLVARKPATPARGRKKAATAKGPEAIADAVKDFPALNRRQVEAWLREEAGSAGASFAAGAEATLLEMVGDDQALLQSEVQKLALAAAGRAIDRALVEEFVSPSDEGVIWRITDLIGRGQAREAMTFAHRFLQRGGEAFQLWNTLLLFVRHAAVMFAAVHETGDSSAAVRDGGVPFPMAQALATFVRGRDQRSIVALVRLAVDLDRSLKNGELRASDEAPSEIQAAIDRLLLALLLPAVSRPR
jgi:DNA polymerase III delta subunit